MQRNAFLAAEQKFSREFEICGGGNCFHKGQVLEMKRMLKIKAKFYKSPSAIWPLQYE
jgi:hypothetical protein